MLINMVILLAVSLYLKFDRKFMELTDGDAIFFSLDNSESDHEIDYRDPAKIHIHRELPYIHPNALVASPIPADDSKWAHLTPVQVQNGS